MKIRSMRCEGERERGKKWKWQLRCVKNCFRYWITQMVPFIELKTSPRSSVFFSKFFIWNLRFFSSFSFVPFRSNFFCIGCMDDPFHFHANVINHLTVKLSIVVIYCNFSFIFFSFFVVACSTWPRSMGLMHILRGIEYMIRFRSMRLLRISCLFICFIAWALSMDAVIKLSQEWSEGRKKADGEKNWTGISFK